MILEKVFILALIVISLLESSCAKVDSREIYQEQTPKTSVKSNEQDDLPAPSTVELLSKPSDEMHGKAQQTPVRLLRIIKNGKFGFIDFKGNVVIEPNFDNVQDFSEGLALVSLNGNRVFINETGETVITPKNFEPINGFTEGLARGNVTNRERYTKGYIDKSGKLVIDNPQISGACEFSEGLACATSDEWGFIDTSGKFVIKPEFEEVGYFSEGLASVKFTGKHKAFRHRQGYIDKTGKVVIKPQFDVAQQFSEGLAAVGTKVGDNYQFGFIDKTGAMIIKPQFELTNSFSEGLVAVRVSKKWGFADKNGNVVIKPEFDKVEEFSEGFAAVAVKGKWGFVDQTGKFVIEPQFNEVHSFSGGLAFVKIGSHDATAIIDFVGTLDTEGKWGYIDKTGKYIWEPTN